MLTTRNQLRRFVIFFPGRTGSSYLVSLLDSHPDIHAEGEVIGGLRPRGADAQIDWARKFLRGPLVGRNRVVGFKTKTRDIEDPDRFAAVLRDIGPNVIFLTRDNDVKHAVSRINAKRIHDITGRWNRRPGEDPLPPLEVTPEELQRHIERAESEKEHVGDYVAALELPTLEVRYEDLVADEASTLRSVLGFVGADDRVLEGATRKNTDDRLSRAVANFDELRAHYAGTKYAAMFEE